MPNICRGNMPNTSAAAFVRSRRWIYFNLLTSGELLEITDSLLPEHRERLYPPTVALSMFMGTGAGRRRFVPEGGRQLGRAAGGGTV